MSFERVSIRFTLQEVGDTEKRPRLSPLTTTDFVMLGRDPYSPQERVHHLLEVQVPDDTKVQIMQAAFLPVDVDP